MAQSAAELPREDKDVCDDLQEAAFSRHCCCCLFNYPCFKSGNWERISTSGEDQPEGAESSSWSLRGVDALKKLREWSEIVAGPKWKTFIRRFNKTVSGKARPSKFQYDAFSYSLNFDEGMAANDQMEADMVSRNFSSRYAAIPATNGQPKDDA